MGRFWDLGSRTSGGKSWTSFIKWSFSNSHRSHLWYKNPLPTSLLFSHRPRVKNPTHCNYKKSQVHLGMKTMAEWLAVHPRCVPPFTCMDWILVIGCPVKNYISQLSLQLDGDIRFSSCQRTMGRNDVCHFQGWPIKTSSKSPHDLLGSLFSPSAGSKRFQNPRTYFKMEGAGCLSTECPHWPVAHDRNELLVVSHWGF